MSEVKSKNKLILRYPSSWHGAMWREGLPSGNGRIGASVYGAVQDETILINHSDLWHWGAKDELPDVSNTLKETRKLMDEGKYLDASWLLANKLKEAGYSTKLSAPLPVCDIKLNMSLDYGFKNYRRELNMETGEVTVHWNQKNGTKYTRKLFVSRADDLVVYEINAENGFINGTVKLAFHDGEDNSTKLMQEEIRASLNIICANDYICYGATNDDNKDYGAVLRVIPTGGRMVSSEEGIQVDSAEKLLILLKPFVKGNKEKAFDSLKGALSKENRSYDELLSAHVALHKPLFKSSELTLSDEEDNRSNEELLLEAYEGQMPTSLIEKMWAYGRYLFISATRDDGKPVNMYGLWGGSYRLMWSHNMANENIQMIYWHVAVGGLTPLMPSFFNYFDSLMEDFKDNAKKLYGCRGIYVPAGSTPGIGKPNQIVPVIMNWTGAAGWLAHHYFEHYLYTGDIDFLREKVLPFMKEISMFYEDFLTIGDDGYYKIYPSVSPENTPLNFIPVHDKNMAHPMPTTINATMEFAILKELLTNLINASQISGIYTDEIQKWKSMLSHIPSYQTNSDGAVREWMNPAFDDRYEHRHLSHIYPVFPGNEIRREDSPELFAAFEKAVHLRKLGAQTGWSLSHMSAIYSRLGDGENALECLNLMSRACLLNNFMTLHNDWRNMGVTLGMKQAPIQIDANMGFVNAVQEMLLYSSAETVKFLPAIPQSLSKGTIRDFRFVTGRVSFSWDIEKCLFSAVITAERATSMDFKLPDFCNKYNVSCNEDNYIKVSLNAGETFEIASK